MNKRLLLSLEDLSPEEVDLLLDLADQFRDEGITEENKGRFVYGLFFDPSLRTRTALEVATVSLGAHFIGHDVGQGIWPLETRDGVTMDGDKSEHVRDAIGKFLSGAVDCIGVRCFADMSLPWEEARQESVLRAVAECSDVPVINLESALFHPMQGLADLQVLRSHLEGDPSDHEIAITWAYHPKALPMAVSHTALLGFTRAGYRVRLVHPPGFELDAEVLARARAFAGDRLETVHDMDEGLAGARVIYAKSWGAQSGYGAPTGDRALREKHRDWIVDARRQALGDPGAFMHCLPVRRNVVASDEVLDGPHSWVAEQARSRIFTQAAALHAML